MAVAYKYLVFSDLSGMLFCGKPVYQCSNHSGELLGLVKWYPSWRQYCFYNKGEIVLSAGCLDDIADFIRRHI